MDDGLGPFEGALRAFHLLLGDVAARTEAAELLQAGGDDFGEVRLLAAVAQFDCLVQTAILERAGNLGRKLARLLARCVEVEVAVDHDGQRPDRHDEQDDGDAAGRPSHVRDQTANTEADPSSTGLLEKHGERRGDVSEVYEMSENHWNLSS